MTGSLLYNWRELQFTFWLAVAVAGAMIFPSAFLHWGPVNLRDKWLLLVMIQAVMFGMGTQMKLADFAGLIRMPQAVLIGVAGQFTIMPLTGWALTKVFTFEPEVAAGIILTGSCSAGLASNVMSYLARANLALSITMTSVTTMLAPVMTPLWMKLLAGELVEVRAFGMMIEIIKMVIVPIGAALLHDYLGFAAPVCRRVVQFVAVIGALWLAFLALGGWNWLGGHTDATTLTLIGTGGFLLAAVTGGAAYHHLARQFPALPRVMPKLSMLGIIYITAVTVAAGRDNLLKVGILLLIAAALHNTLGYVLGYGLARACRLDVASARTVAFEVGLQNGGMASGIAGALGKLGTMGLAAAIFSPWMNISGSLLANYWRRRPGGESVVTGGRVS